MPQAAFDRSSARHGAVSRRLLLAGAIAVGVLVVVLAIVESAWELSMLRIHERTANPPGPRGAGSP